MFVLPFRFDSYVIAPLLGSSKLKLFRHPRFFVLLRLLVRLLLELVQKQGMSTRDFGSKDNLVYSVSPKEKSRSQYPIES